MRHRSSSRTRPRQALALAVLLLGCGGPKETPPEVEAEYRELLEGLDEELPGAAAARLQAFRERNDSYTVASEVDAEIERLRSQAAGRYHQARELAREGAFDRARILLEDLAIHLPDTADGESAKEHLEGEFDLNQAQWLASRQRWKESEQVARSALQRGVRQPYAGQLESMLDNAAVVDAARSVAERTQGAAACRQAMILLEVQMAEDGEYPRTFSLADVEAYDPVGSRGVRRSLSAIEGYRPTSSGYDLVCVGADGRSRIRVVDGNLEW